MKIILCYKEYELGELTKEADEWVFKTIGGCEIAKQKYIIPRASQLLSGGVKRSKTLFGEFAYFFKLLDNSYIKSEAGVIDEDSEEEKLIKISRLNLSTSSFYIKSRN